MVCLPAIRDVTNEHAQHQPRTHAAHTAEVRGLGVTADAAQAPERKSAAKLRTAALKALGAVAGGSALRGMFRFS